jgi:LysM repeat protein
MRQPIRVLLFTVIVALFGAGIVGAQDDNLLRDGGFEGAFTSRGRADLNIPQDWSIWVADTPHTEDWMNLPVVGFPHSGIDPAQHSGAQALNLNKGYATFTAALYQQVSVTNGANISGSAYAFLRTCRIPDGSDRCQSTPDSNAFTRIGIDPNGGTNPFDEDVVWSSNAAPHETWQQMTVSATATGATVTLFLYATQQWPSQLNNVYWDDAVLSVGGSGGVAASAPGEPTPQPTSASIAPLVSEEGARPDGSIVYVVVAGDTLDSVAFAYGLTRADILALNPNITDPRIIQIGQEIVVKGATVPPTPEPTPETNPDGSAVTEEPPEAVRNAAPAPVISVGTAVSPIDPANRSASVCVVLFEDGNGNRIQDRGEDVLPGGSIAVHMDGTPVSDHATDSQPDPFCFDNLAAGNYVVSAAAPPGYGLTTPDQLRVQAYPGAQVSLAFGAAQGVEPIVLPPSDEQGGIVNTENTAQTDTRSSNPLSRNIGLIVFAAAGVVLIAGMGITVFMRRR